MKQYTLQPDSEWWPRCNFIQQYFIGPQKIIAQELAVYLAEEFVGKDILMLRPDTDLSILFAERLSDSLQTVEAAMWLEQALAGEGPFEVVTFKDLVRAVQTNKHDGT